jgi:hypothetical protein
MLLLFSLAGVTACAAGDTSSGGGFGGSDAHGATHASTSGAGGSSATESTATSFVGSGGAGATAGGPTTSVGAGGQPPPVVYAHTNTTLSELDPVSLQLSPVGDFDCIGTGSGQDTSMTDVAVDSQGALWGISKSNVYELQIQGNSVHCAQQIPLHNSSGIVFYALTFAPVGVLDPQKEVLVAGNTAGQLWAVDAAGNLTQHGIFGDVPANDGLGHDYMYPGGLWELSGDLVFVANGGSPLGFATVRDCQNPPDSSSCDPSDTLVEIDMTALATQGAQNVTRAIRGMVVQGTGCSMNDTHSEDFGKLYGIGAWSDKIYGFSNSGALLDISNVDATACLVSYFSSDKWAGAGVTTQAPVIAPPVH